MVSEPNKCIRKGNLTITATWRPMIIEMGRVQRFVPFPFLFFFACGNAAWLPLVNFVQFFRLLE